MLLATHAMGTRFELVLPDEDTPGLRAAGEEALREIDLWHARLSRFQPDSRIAAINRDRTARLDPVLFELLDLCRQVERLSDGAFDVSLGQAMDQLGRHPREASDAAPAACNGPEAGFVLDPTNLTIQLAAPAALDLGAVAKGFALDRAAERLLDAGVTSALLHGGTSSVVAIGVPPEDPAGWTIAVRCEPAGSEPLTLYLRDQSLGVSAPRGRVIAGEYHILDPRTRTSARSAVDTAAVLGSLGAAAACDAWSTALIVLGDHAANLPPDLVPHIHTPARGWSSRTPCLTEPA